MIFFNARYANESNGILLDQDSGRPIYVDAGPLYDRAIDGEFGSIAPYVPPEPLPEEPTN